MDLSNSLRRFLRSNDSRAVSVPNVAEKASGRTLFYGMGEWMSARGLAESMKAAGAENAAEIDINWSYTRFLFFGHPAPGDPLQVTSALVPKSVNVAA